MTVDEQAKNQLIAAIKEGNETEKTISLQLLALGTFLLTVIGAFIVSDIVSLDIVLKVFLLINILILSFSLAAGIIHLLLVMKMWIKTIDKLTTAREAAHAVDGEAAKAKVFNRIAAKDNATSMTFFQWQIGLLSVGFAVFIGLIVAILF